MKKNILAVVAAAIWINASEFLRNEALLNSYWVRHYETLGLTFPLVEESVGNSQRGFSS